MARNKLTAVQVRNLIQPGRYNDGAGLYLFVNQHGSRSWVFRYRDRQTGKHRDKGLGPVDDITLSHARKLAHNCRLQLHEGTDPVEATKADRQARRIARARRVTFGECCKQYIEAHRAGWRNKKHASQWRNTLNKYAERMMSLPVGDIDTNLVMQCLEPDWQAKPETMTRVRQRIEAVLAWATARHYREGDNPARWHGHLEHMLPKRSKVQPVQHRPALPYAEMGEFMADLRSRDSLAARCLEFQILTATRPGEAAGAQWPEIDIEDETWTVPAGRMKAGHDHRIPLSKPVVALLRDLPSIDSNLFPGVKGRPITTASPLKIAKSIKNGITAHGFRATFRDWAGDMTAHPREIIEAAMAHRLKDKAEAAYRRNDAMARRARLMADWAKHCDTLTGGDVVAIRRTAQ
ncbi:tyrosine-type recombinase/integrase [Salinisphaera orenii]|uniref:tyrosine-type recombinase/integrase n=1 Tax=Salinisphaera orenii TaxID=856731 RepID=UPI000DBE611D